MQNSTSNLQKNQSLVSSNGMESFSISLAKKCERLSTALYLVTNFLSDIEPMKYRLRALSLDLVRDASLVRYGTIANEANVLETLRANISETLSLLELAFIAGLVSEMNFSILKHEYVVVRDSVEIKRATRESRTDSILGDTFFDSAESHRVSRLGAMGQRPDLYVPASRTQGSPLRNLGQRVTLSESAPVNKLSTFNLGLSTSSENPIGHSKGQSNIQMSDRNPAPAPRTQGLTLRSLGQRSDLSESVSRTPDIARSARHARILKLIKDNREVSIKDIANYFPELSEKTIQRELVSFTESGVLKKVGERRWSRYSLV